MYFDSTYILIFASMAVALLASLKLKMTFSKYSRIRSVSGYTGKDVAAMILRANGIYDISVVPVSGQLTDHYSSRDKCVRLSDSTYNSSSIAALSVAAHECGHAIQDQENYAPLSFRSALVPAANFGSRLSWPLILIGLMLGKIGGIFITIGIILFMAVMLFQIITLPVEFNASKRALRQLEDGGILSDAELPGARSVLFAAALTYVAAAASSLLHFLRLILLRRR